LKGFNPTALQALIIFLSKIASCLASGEKIQYPEAAEYELNEVVDIEE
jgi:hypothetical protein